MTFGEIIPVGGGDPVPLLKEKLLVGRRSSCDITLRFPNVSSHHCELELINGYWKVKDLGSTNGIRVNGERCESRFLLPGDLLSVGKHRYEMQYEPIGDEPPLEDVDPFSQSLMEKAGLEKTDRPQRKRPNDFVEASEFLPKNDNTSDTDFFNQLFDE